MAGASFKETWAVESTFTGGFKDADQVLIVGHDIPVEDWNQDVADPARLAGAFAYLDPSNDEGTMFKASIARFGVTDEVKVIKRRDMILAVDGRTRILGAREVNLAKVKAGDRQLVKIPIVPDKSLDVAFTVRIQNEFRRDDPVWVKAQQAAHLRSLGKADKDIMVAFRLKTPQALAAWFTYLGLAQEVRALVEDEACAVRCPFKVATEIAKLGEHEDRKHVLAWETLRNVGAVLTGEQGWKNASLVVKLIQAGTLKVPPPPGSSPAALSALLEGEPADPASTPHPGADGDQDGSGDEGDGDGPASEDKAQEGRKRASPGPKTPGGARGGKTTGAITGAKFAPAAIRQVCALLEPTKGGPTKTDAQKIAYAVLAVVTGKDPTAEGLGAWPDVQAMFHQAGRSPIVAQDRPAAGQVGSCDAPHCDKGVNTKKNKPCSKCDGSGKKKVA